MFILNIDEKRCKGCGFCIAQCPRKALSLSGKFNKQGIETVKVDDDRCIKCGICYTVCPDYVFAIVNTDISREEESA